MVPELWPGQIGQIRAVSMVTALFPHPVKPEPYMLARQFWYLPSLNHVSLKMFVIHLRTVKLVVVDI